MHSLSYTHCSTVDVVSSGSSSSGGSVEFPHDESVMLPAALFLSETRVGG